MKGIILDFNEQTKKGLIRGADEGKYEFAVDDWKFQNRKPKAGLEVDFDHSDNKALNVYLIQTSSACDIKDATVETAIKTGNGLLKIMKVLVPSAVVVVALIVLGNLLYEKHEETKMANENIAEFLNIKKEAEAYYANKQYSEAIKVYERLNALHKWHHDIGQIKNSYAPYELDFTMMTLYKQLGMWRACYDHYTRSEIPFGDQHDAQFLDEADLLIAAPNNKFAAGVLEIEKVCSSEYSEEIRALVDSTRFK